MTREPNSSDCESCLHWSAYGCDLDCEEVGDDECELPEEVMLSEHLKVMECKICQQEIKGSMLNCSKGSICMDCAKDLNSAMYQPLTSFNDILWCLAETFFRKGKGKEVTFEEVWNSNNNLKLVKFIDLFDKNKVIKL